MEAIATVAEYIKLKTLGTNTYKLLSSSLLLSRCPLETIQKESNILYSPFQCSEKLMVRGLGEALETPEKESREVEVQLPLESFVQFVPPFFALLFLID